MLQRREWLTSSLLLLLTGCQKSRPRTSHTSNDRIVLYCAQDLEYIETILQDFRQATGMKVDIKGDTESNKTVGLFESVRRERQQPRADVFWSNEPVLMQRLSAEGLLERYQSPSAKDYPGSSRPADACWQGFAARARILLVARALAAKERPQGIQDLTNPKWQGRIAMAKPFFGSTASHMACLCSSMGELSFKSFCQQLKPQVALLPGNKDVARAVAQGRYHVGLTDTDDAIIEVIHGFPVEMVFPDQSTCGTLLLPNAIALVKNGPNPQAGKQLIDYVLSADVEKQLAEGPSAQIPLNPKVQAKHRLALAPTLKTMQVDFVNAAQNWDVTQRIMREVFSS